jgi:D-inositol-3-phosphate glycosyltransferase
MESKSLAHEISVALLTGGRDKPYAFGLAQELMSRRVALDLIGGDDLDCPKFHASGVNFLNLRGDQRPNSGFRQKMIRLLKYYIKLIRYAATAKPKIFHILWNNKVEFFDRTILMQYYRFLGKRIVLTAHNVNAANRDSTDNFLNRLTLRAQYQLSDHIFVHTEKMKAELVQTFKVDSARVSIIPFGINNAVPDTPLSPQQARQRLGIRLGEKTLLFFGYITPYKGLEYLISAFKQILPEASDYRLIIAGKPKNCDEYWSTIQNSIREELDRQKIILRPQFIPEDDTELYFKAADVLVLPYRRIYQSGVLLLGYSFGVPALAADVGSLRAEIIEGETGFVFKPEDSVDLARTIKRYFASDLFAQLNFRRPKIRQIANERHSWESVGQLTTDVYAGLFQAVLREDAANVDLSIT